MAKQDDLYAEVAAAHSGAFDRLVRGYEAVPDKQQDLLQDIHLALWQSFEGYEGRCSIPTWVHRVAHNTAASHVVKEQRKNATPLVTLEEIESAVHPNHTEGAADRRIALQRLTELIRLLKPLDRQLMLLYLEGVDAESMGEIVGTSAGHVRVQVHRVKNILARRFHGGSAHE